MSSASYRGVSPCGVGRRVRCPYGAPSCHSPPPSRSGTPRERYPPGLPFPRSPKAAQESSPGLTRSSLPRSPGLLGRGARISPRTSLPPLPRGSLGEVPGSRVCPRSFLPPLPRGSLREAPGSVPEFGKPASEGGETRQGREHAHGKQKSLSLDIGARARTRIRPDHLFFEWYGA